MFLIIHVEEDVIMKRSALFVLMLTLTASLAHSQVLIALLFGDKLNSDRFQLGIQLAGNFQNVTGWEGTGNRFAVGFGIYGELKLTEKLSLQPELLFKDPRGADGVPGHTFDNPDLDPLLADATVSMKLAYVSIPILLKYHLNPQLSIGFGPQIGILSSAKNVYTAPVEGSGDLSFKEDLSPYLNDIDMALGFNLEYKLMKTKRPLRIGLRYYLGLTDIIKDNPGSPVRHSVIQINLGIPVGKAPKD
jgi:hypothetical protein